jgi:hypothetical protein
MTDPDDVQRLIYWITIGHLASVKVLEMRLSKTLAAQFSLRGSRKPLRSSGDLSLAIPTRACSSPTAKSGQKLGRRSGVVCSMDGKGHWIGNVFMKRLARSVKSGALYLHVYTHCLDALTVPIRHFNLATRLDSWDEKPSPGLTRLQAMPLHADREKILRDLRCLRHATAVAFVVISH